MYIYPHSWFYQTVNKVESRYVMEPSTEKSGGSALEWWSAESELSIWPSARQIGRKFLTVACRAVVLNETVYQRVASTNVTSAAALTVQQVQLSSRSSASSIPSSGTPSGQQHQVSASMASSHHSRDSYTFSAASKGSIDTLTYWLLFPKKRKRKIILAVADDSPLLFDSLDFFHSPTIRI